MMNTNAIALIIQEGTKVATELIKYRLHKLPSGAVMVEGEEEEGEEVTTLIEGTSVSAEKTAASLEKASAPATGCVPCSLGHLGTCTGVLNEAMRFARQDGISEEVVDRINICMDELNTLERVDLRPEMITELPAWEKGLAEKALAESRSLRHSLESITSVDSLELTAAETQKARQEIGRAYFQERIRRMSPEEKEMVENRMEEKLNVHPEDKAIPFPPN